MLWASYTKVTLGQRCPTTIAQGNNKIGASEGLYKYIHTFLACILYFHFSILKKKKKAPSKPTLKIAQVQAAVSYREVSECSPNGEHPFPVVQWFICDGSLLNFFMLCIYLLHMKK